jgi:uncharacterized surface protein with fasciclin (FAS1) repeats
MLLVCACSKKQGLSYQVQDRKTLMFDMLKKDTSMSITVAALEKAKLDGALDSYGPYTFFAPDNNAFRKYFRNTGKNSLDDFTDSALKVIMTYHILPVRLKAQDFIQGPQSTPTGGGDYISLDISKGYKSSAVANGVATIYETNIEYYNGFVHKMDAVLDPPVLTIGQFLRNNPDKYSILIGGLEKAGLMDTLTDLTDINGTRIRLTLFAETNDVLQAAGINDFSALDQDSLVRLMRNHIVPGGGFSSSYTHLTTAIPGINVVERWDSTVLTLDRQDWIYFDLAASHLIDGTTDFTASDIIMRNGIMHNVSQPLSFPASKKRTQIYHIFWSSTNYCYGIPGFSDGNSSPVANAGSGNWRYYYEGGDPIPQNYLFMNPDGIGDSLVTVVRNVRKGTYRIEVNYKNAYNRGVYELRNGTDSIGTADFKTAPTFQQKLVIGRYNFQTSGDKRLNFVCKTVGGINLSCLVLTPEY